MKEKQYFQQELAASRHALRRDLHSLREELDLGKKLGKIVGKKPALWMAGAAFTGFVVSMFSFRRHSSPAKKMVKDKTSIPSTEEVVKESPPRTMWSFLFSLIKLLLPIIRPLVTAYASKRMAAMAISMGSK